MKQPAANDREGQRLAGSGWWIPPLVALLGALIYVSDPLALQVLRNTVFDQYQRWDRAVYQDTPVTIVDIDEESLARIGQWPWPRTYLAELIDSLHAGGAAAIGLDIILAEPDRTSPAAMLETWQAPADLRAALNDLPAHDEVLRRSIAAAPVVLGHTMRPEGSPDALVAYPFLVAERGGTPAPFLLGYDGSATPLPELQQAAAGIGALNFAPESDGVIRKMPLLLRLGDEVVPALVTEVLRVAQGQPLITVTTSPQRGAGVERIQVGEVAIATDARGEIWLRYTSGHQRRVLPAWQVLQDPGLASRVDGHAVLIGSSAQGLLDLRFSPLGEIVPGVWIHAMALDQVLLGDQLARPNWSVGAELVLLVCGSLLLGFIALRVPALVSAAWFGLLVATAAAGGWIAFQRYDLLLDPISPATALALAFVAGSLHHHFATERQQRWIQQAFARYVSPNRVDYLVAHPEALQLGGRRQECSFIFTDLAGFTALMESLDPDAAVTLLNDYLDNMVRIAFAHDGTLDRIVGDAVAIMFSAPVPQPDHAARALRCAAELHAFAADYAARARDRGIALGATRIGIHSGEVTVGNFGGRTMFDYRALGDPVNTAARLESVNKQLGTTVCVSAATLSGAPDTPTRPVGRLVLKGKTEPLMVHEPLFATDPARRADDAAYQAAWQQMREGDERAATLFDHLAAVNPEDGLVSFHAHRLKDGDRGDLVVLGRK
jgi:adenylate cyclase